MPIDKNFYQQLVNDLQAENTTLVAVSKLQPISKIIEIYNLGQLDFGENYVQELVEKKEQLPEDIRWHFIGHLQSNKVKYIAPFVHLIHGIDSLKLLKQVHKEGKKAGRVINVLLQMHIAMEETKFGMDEAELDEVIKLIGNDSEIFSHVKINGLMGMASFSDDLEKVRGEMKFLASLFEKYKPISNPIIDFTTLSMGMSGDYKMAMEEGSTMVRIGSLLFGNRG